MSKLILRLSSMALFALVLSAAALAQPMSGSYTIDPGGSGVTNFTTFNGARNALVANGVSGPVTFTVAAGTYNEMVDLPAITGASSTNTITFDGVNKTTRILTYQHYSYNATFKLNSAKWIVIKNLTIEAYSSAGAYSYAYGYALHFQDNATDNEVMNCNIKATSNPLAYNYYFFPVVMGGWYQYAYGMTSNNYVHHCTMDGGYSSVWIYGTYGNGPTNIRYEYNTMTNGYYYGIYALYTDQLKVKNNYISGSPLNMYGYGVMMQYVNGMEIENNTVLTGYMGLYFWYNNMVGNISRARIVNNMIACNGNYYNYGIYAYYHNNCDFWHNSINVGGGTGVPSYAWMYAFMLYYSTDVDVRNNTIKNSSASTTYNLLWYSYGTTFTGGSNFNYNNWFSSAPTNTYIAYYNGTYYNTVPAFLAASNQPNSINIDPGYVSATDLHMDNNRRLVRKGTALGVANDLDGDPRNPTTPSIGADEGCYVPDGGIAFEMTDQSGNPVQYYNVPGTVYVKYSISYPLSQQVNAQLTARFYTVGPNPQLVATHSWAATKPANQVLNGIQPITLSLSPGFYRIELVFNTMNTCNLYGDEYLYGLTMLLNQGQTPCIVWPGDVNNDGLVNYGDRRALNTYITNANLRSTWLSGPARYRLDFATNPFTYYKWEGQTSVPWQTAEGCYMDSDGNGMINSFDNLAIKLNWMKTHGIPKDGSQAFSATNFDLDQNYPNPFNPSTMLRFSAPERSQVRLVVTDVLGRTITTLVNGAVEAGVHTVPFDATTLESGQYIATITMTGIESNLSFSKTIKMTLVK
ncbi:MAG: right-handed parallel beta-helix repeat-containing protein [Ignavibacteriae bacterium]|nr:right-handed parallel beta-helix repeat-containing protein [Ignavibacteriota bacterium]